MMTWIEKLALSCDVREIPSNEILEATGLQYGMTDGCPILCTNINEVDNVSYLLSMTKDNLQTYLGVNEPKGIENEVYNGRSKLFYIIAFGI